MSRFGTYLLAAKLAKMELATADEKWRKRDMDDAVIHTIRAVREVMVAMNNVASMQFEKKRARRKAVRS